MSLSWKDEQPLTPRTSFDVYGSDLRKTTDDEYAPPLNTAATVQETSPIHHVPPTIRQTGVKPEPKKEKKKCRLLRPVAWLEHILLTSLIVLLVRIVLLLAAYEVHKLSSAPTISVILVTLLFGGVTLSIFTSGFIYLPMLLLSVSEAIYPSNHGFRYYFISVIGLFFNVVAIAIAIFGSVEADFWYYAETIYLAILHISLMLIVKQEKL